MLYGVGCRGALESASTPGIVTSSLKIHPPHKAGHYSPHKPCVFMIWDRGPSLCETLVDIYWTQKAGCENKQTLPELKSRQTIYTEIYSLT